MDTWLKAIGEALRWGPMNIWVGFSFLMESFQEGERKVLIYSFVFSALFNLECRRNMTKTMNLHKLG